MIEKEEKHSIKGIKARQAAAKKRHVAGHYANELGDNLGARLYWEDAKYLDEQADKSLTVATPFEVGPGGEAIPSDEVEGVYGIRETLRSGADWINLDASSDRLELLADGNALALAADAAQSIQAQNSIEKMLIHQMSLCHKVGMKIITKAEEMAMYPKHQGHIDQSVKLVNAAARLMNVYQSGIHAFAKLRGGNSQKITVQHQYIQVDNQGGQAVIGQSIEGGQRGDKDENR